MARRRKTKKVRRRIRNSRGSASSGNVFADLRVESPREALYKAEIARLISGIIEERGWSQERAAEILEIDQPKISKLVRGRLDGFSIERLLRFLNAFGCDVEIVVNKADPGPAGVRVVVNAAAR